MFGITKITVSSSLKCMAFIIMIKCDQIDRWLLMHRLMSYSWHKINLTFFVGIWCYFAQGTNVIPHLLHVWRVCLLGSIKRLFANYYNWNYEYYMYKLFIKSSIMWGNRHSWCLLFNSWKTFIMELSSIYVISSISLYM